MTGYRYSPTISSSSSTSSPFSLMRWTSLFLLKNYFLRREVLILVSLREVAVGSWYVPSSPSYPFWCSFLSFWCFCDGLDLLQKLVPSSPSYPFAWVILMVGREKREGIYGGWTSMLYMEDGPACYIWRMDQLALTKSEREREELFVQFLG
jgi:hypothetical protein